MASVLNNAKTYADLKELIAGKEQQILAADVVFTSSSRNFSYNSTAIDHLRLQLLRVAILVGDGAKALQYFKGIDNQSILAAATLLIAPHDPVLAKKDRYPQRASSGSGEKRGRSKDMTNEAQ